MNPLYFEARIQKFKYRTAKIAAIGLTDAQQRVRLPLAIVFAEAGFDVSGVEVDSCKVGKDTRKVVRL
jgi:UDP-N-acetyl-D-mannosaminuronate dehydrogenase